jgi:hypothetical protein
MPTDANDPQTHYHQAPTDNWDPGGQEKTDVTDQ